MTHCLIADRWVWSSALLHPADNLPVEGEYQLTQRASDQLLSGPHCHHRANMPITHKPTSYHLIQPLWTWRFQKFFSQIWAGVGWIFLKLFSLNRPLFPPSFGKRKQGFSWNFLCLCLMLMMGWQLLRHSLGCMGGIIWGGSHHHTVSQVLKS